MESALPSGVPETELFSALEAAEPAQATAALSTLADSLHGQGRAGLNLDRAWKAFQRLLSRRGYFVDAPAQLTASLREIRAVGAGFDLYDLARGLALYDVVLTTCRKLIPHRALPELQSFASTCACSCRRKEA